MNVGIKISVHETSGTIIFNGKVCLCLYVNDSKDHSLLK